MVVPGQATESFEPLRWLSLATGLSGHLLKLCEMELIAAETRYRRETQRRIKRA